MPPPPQSPVEAFQQLLLMTPRERADSMAEGSTFTSVPSETVPAEGGDVWMSTTSGWRVVASITGTSDRRHG